MKKFNPILTSLFQALGAFIYILLLINLMNYGRQFFLLGQFWTLVAMLMIFVLSAAITGFLIFGKPAILFIEGNKKDGLKLLGLTIGCL